MLQAIDEGIVLSVAEMLAFHVRMPEDVKQRLEKEAQINGRSLNAEVVDRLKRSLSKQLASSHRASESDATGYQAPALSDADRQLLAIFRKLSPEKQLALISLFK